MTYLQLIRMQLKKKLRALMSRRKKIAKPLPRIIPAGCVVCRSVCIDDFKVREMRITRSITRLLERFKEFIILEIYRCMPLLGNESDNAPDWDVHIVRYSIVFTNID